MEVTTIVGIVIASIVCLLGLYLILRKSNDAAPSLDTELHVNAESNQPVIPRHVRDQLQPVLKPSSERVEPSLSSETADIVVDENKIEESSEGAITSVEKVEDQASLEVKEKGDQIQVEAADSEGSEPEKNEQVATDSDVKSNEKVVQPAFVLNPNVNTAEIEEFNDESNILDVHLHEQQRCDDESELANAEYIISLNMYPNPRKALSGDKTMKVLLKYGLRFGEMNCFHRYESPDAESPLMFSVLRITDQGPAGFDLESLSGEQVQGLAFFLALPHQNVQKGFDSMVSIAGLIARETDGTVYDENNLEFTPQLKEHWRHKAIDYRSGQRV